MTMKPFEIQSPSLSINGVLIDTSAQGKLVIPGVTRAGTSVAIEVDDTGDQSVTWSAIPTVIDGFTYQVYIAGNETAPIGWTAATYEVDEIDDDGYIDGISVTSGGAGYSGQVNAFAKGPMYAAPQGTPLDFASMTDWVLIPFKVRCGAGEIESEFNGGGGGVSALENLEDVQLNGQTNGQALVWDSNDEVWKNQTISGGTGGAVVERTVNFPTGATGDTSGTIALDPDGNVYVCATDWVDYSEGVEFTVETTELYNLSQSGTLMSIVIAKGTYPEIDSILESATLPLSGWVAVNGPTTDGYTRECTAETFAGTNWAFTWTYVGGQDNNEIPQGTEFSLVYTQAQPAIWKQVNTGAADTGNVVFDGDQLYVGGTGFLDLRTSDNQVELGSNNTGSLILSVDEGTQRWEFDADGGLTFPDGTTQTTAYTGQTGNYGDLYIMANLDGNIITSTNGVTWGDPVASGMNGINRVEVHDGVIVYVPGAEGPPGSGVSGLYYSTVIGTTTLCAGTDTFMEAPVYWNNVHYFTNTNKWVAVGFIAGGTNHFPIVAYSDNGTSWTLVPIDNTFATSFNPDNRDWDLTDVAYITESSQYVITSSILHPDTYGGIFVTQDITAPLDGNTHLAVQKNFWEVASWSVTAYNGPSGYMILIPWTDGPGINSIPWFGFGTVVSNYSEANNGWWVDDVVNQIGYLPFISEVAYDNNDFIAVTGGGHVITPAFNGGPSFVVSIPLPYTTTDFTITNANPAVLTYNLTHSLTDNEKIVITDAGEFNGTYFWKESDGTLYTDQTLTTALDSSGFAAFASGGTLTASHGQYFDAAGTSSGYYYIGNDDEQVFRSSNGIDWVLQKDVDGVYFNDFAYGAWGSSTVSHLDYLDETTGYASSARLTYDFDVDVDNAHLNIRGDGSWDIGSSNFRTKIYSAGPEEPTLVIVQATDKYWTFSPDGKLNFPDGTRQQTAYVQRNVNLDGGGAMAHYDVEVDVAFVDGGFSSTRHGVADASFDGGNRLTEANQYNLDGGGA